MQQQVLTDMKPIRELNFYTPDRLSDSTLVRYVKIGMASSDGKRRVKLNAKRIGRAWYATQNDVDELIRDVNTPTPPVRSARKREREVAVA